jgi:hypothetical protein
VPKKNTCISRRCPGYAANTLPRARSLQNETCLIITAVQYFIGLLQFKASLYYPLTFIPESIATQDRPFKHCVTLRSFHATFVTVEDHIMYSEYMFVALVIQHKKCIILSYLTSQALSYFSTTFRKKLFDMKVVFSFSLQISSETFLIVTRIQLDIVINVDRSSYIIFTLFIPVRISRQL